MADPFQELIISKNILKINFFLWYSMGSWYQTDLTYVFRFQEDKLTLIGAEYNEVHRGNSNGVHRSFNFSTKKMSETQSELNSNGDLFDKNTEWFDLPIQELKTIETLTKPLDWEPIIGKQI